MDKENLQLLIIVATLFAIFNIGGEVILKLEGITIIGNAGVVILLAIALFVLRRIKKARA